MLKVELSIFITIFSHLFVTAFGSKVAISDAVVGSVTCFVCSDCPKPIKVNTQYVIEQKNCGECYSTSIGGFGGDPTYFVRGCLPTNIPCSKYRSTYYLPYTMERKYNITPQSYITKSGLPNITHECCTKDYCNSGVSHQYSIVPMMVSGILAVWYCLKF